MNIRIFQGALLLGAAVVAGCATQQTCETEDHPVRRMQCETAEVAEGVTKTVVDVSEEGVNTIHNAGKRSGVTPAVQGVSQAIVDASEEIGKEQRGKMMGQEVILFPPETENEGKILKIEF